MSEDKVTPRVLGEYGDKENDSWYGTNNHEICRAIGTLEEKPGKALDHSPTEEEVCEYWEEFGDSDTGPSNVPPATHKAACNWAEENC